MLLILTAHCVKHLPRRHLNVLCMRRSSSCMGEWCEQEQFCVIRSAPVLRSPRSFGFLGILQWNLQLSSSNIWVQRSISGGLCVFSPQCCLFLAESRFPASDPSSCFRSGIRGSRNGIRAKAQSQKCRLRIWLIPRHLRISTEGDTKKDTDVKQSLKVFAFL
jgi:hypothetical protein